MLPLPLPDMAAIIQQHVPDRALARIMLATAMTEAPIRDSTGAVTAVDLEAAGDRHPQTGNYQSHGPYQMHDRGAGRGIPLAQRQDPHFATRYMYETEFRGAWDQARWRFSDPSTQAVYTYLRAERPQGYRSPDDPGWGSRAAEIFAANWQALADFPWEDPMPVTIPDLVLSHAETMLGMPYALPPDGLHTVDCSLFVLLAFRMAGFPFPEGVRTAEQIRLACDPVTDNTRWQNDLVQRGDLLFFERTYAGNPGERATHVGFALLGRKMLDANDARGNVGYTLLGPWWQERLFEARRPRQYTQALPTQEPPQEEVPTPAPQEFDWDAWRRVVDENLAALNEDFRKLKTALKEE
jgi:cell wall-associated NlpC family hydrolase